MISEVLYMSWKTQDFTLNVTLIVKTKFGYYGYHGDYYFLYI